MAHFVVPVGDGSGGGWYCCSKSSISCFVYAGGVYTCGLTTPDATGVAGVAGVAGSVNVGDVNIGGGTAAVASGFTQHLFVVYTASQQFAPFLASPAEQHPVQSSFASKHDASFARVSLQHLDVVYTAT